MSAPAWTPEPWDTAPSQPVRDTQQLGDMGIIARVGELPAVIGEAWRECPMPGGRKHVADPEANAERIVRCVNACAGLEIPPGAPQGALAELVDAAVLAHTELHFVVDHMGRRGGKYEQARDALAEILTKLGRL